MIVIIARFKTIFFHNVPIYWHAASMVSLRWPTTVHPAFSANAFSFSRCSKLIRVLVLFNFWLERSIGFLVALPQLCIPHAFENNVIEFFTGGPPTIGNRCDGEVGVSRDCVARFSIVMTGLASDEEGPSWRQVGFLSFWNVDGFRRSSRHFVVELITYITSK
jgi:hypothetical protein